MPSSSSSSTQQQLKTSPYCKKLFIFFLFIFSLFSRLFKTLISSLSSAMDEIFDPDDFLSVDFDTEDSNEHARRRRRIEDSTSSACSHSLRHDRVFLVSYQWWSDARKECFGGGGGGSEGVRYVATALNDEDDDDQKDDDFVDEIVLEFKRQDDNKGEGVCGRKYALISESMWFKALKW